MMMESVNLFKIIRILPVLFVLASLANTVSAHSSGTSVACDPSEVPAEHVIVGVKSAVDCPFVDYSYKNPSDGMWTCGNFDPHVPVPAGFVVTSTGTDSQNKGIDCSTSPGSHYGVTEYIELPGNGDWVCDTATIPDGYGIDTISGSTSTTGCSTTGYRLEVLNSDTETLCDIGIPIPTTYVATENNKTSSSCDGAKAMVISKMPVVATQWICELTSPDIPDGWNNYLITTVGTTSACLGAAYRIDEIDDVNFTCNVNSLAPTLVPTGETPTAGCYFVEDLSDLGVNQTTSFCQLGRPVPPGFVVTQITNNNSCGSQKTYFKVVNPNMSSTYTMCSVHTLPEGFAVTGSVTTSSCNGLAAYTISAAEEGTFCGIETVVPDQMVVLNVSDGASYCPVGDSTYTLGFPNQSGSTNICLPAYTANYVDFMPENYVVTSHSTADNNNCDGRPGLSIRKPSESGTTRVCHSSPLPSEYAIVSSGIDTSICGGIEGGRFWDVKKLTDNSHTVCGVIPDQVVAGYVGTGRLSLAECDEVVAGTYNAIALTKPSTTSDTLMCYQSPFPAGFARVAKVNHADCNSSTADEDSNIRYVAGSSAVQTICFAEDLPANWGIVGYSTTGECQIRIAPNDSSSGGGSITPNEFVDSENENLGPIVYDCANTVNEPSFLISNPTQNDVDCL